MKYAVEAAMHPKPVSIAQDLEDRRQRLQHLQHLQHKHRLVLIHHLQALHLQVLQVVVVEEEVPMMIMWMMIYTTTC